MPTDKPAYPFEEASSHSVRQRERAIELLPIFRARLGMPPDTPEAAHAPRALDELLQRYIIEVQLNIEWYAARLQRERRLRRVYVMLSSVLFVVIPLLIWLLSSGFDPRTAAPQESGAAHSTAAEITAVITGILAVHQALAAWLDKRHMVGHFWRASADLKELLYSFEGTWRAGVYADPGEGAGEGESKGIAPAFLEALSADIGRARQIVRKEREGFYELYNTPAFDVVQRLSAAFSQAQGLTKQFSAPGLSERAQRDQEEQTLRRRQLALSAEREGLQHLIAEEQRAAHAADEPATRARIDQNLIQLYRAVDQVRQELIKVDAALVALARS